VKALQFDHVSAGYGRTTVLRDVSLAVPQGKTVALLGANGAGKTTLLRTAAGLVRPTAGEIRIGDQRAEQLPEHARSKLGLCLIPEGHAIFRSLTVRENLAMFSGGGHPRTPGHGGRDVDAAVERAAAAFPVLGRRLTQAAGTLSGGEQQMLALTRALVTDPRVILADELSLGLAPIIVDEIFAVVDRLRGEGRSLLIVEQFVGRVLDIADYVYILHKGAVAFVGEPGQCRQDERLFEQYVGSVA
jgi:branched-chain amino acid transport system ATP-binding protein